MLRSQEGTQLSLGNTAIQTCNGSFSVSSVPVERRMEENM
jgi:hypothetical protein